MTSPEVQVPVSTFGWLFHAMFGPAPVPPKPPEIAAWENEGGPPADDGHDHVWRPAPR